MRLLSQLVVSMLWVPSRFHIANLLSHLHGDFSGDNLRAKCMGWLIYRQVRRDTLVVDLLGCRECWARHGSLGGPLFLFFWRMT